MCYRDRLQLSDKSILKSHLRAALKLTDARDTHTHTLTQYLYYTIYNIGACVCVCGVCVSAFCECDMHMSNRMCFFFIYLVVHSSFIF